MKLQLNGEEIEQGGDRATVQELLAARRYTFPLIVVKVNGVFVPREEYGNAGVRAGDVVEAYHLVSGG